MLRASLCKDGLIGLGKTQEIARGKLRHIEDRTTSIFRLAAMP